MTTSGPAVTVSHLRKTYGPVVAVDDVSFEVAEGEIVGVQLQASALPARLRVGEILQMYRSLYRAPADVRELTEALGPPGRRATITGRCRAGSASGCRSRWRSSGSRGSRCWMR